MEGLGTDYSNDELNRSDQDNEYPVSEDMVVWMTEPTPWILAPRSDCG